MFTYNTPAGILDMPDGEKRTAFLAAWDHLVSGWFADNIRALGEGEKYFFTEAQIKPTGDEVGVPWDAFPLSLKRTHKTSDELRWAAADQLGQLDRGIGKEVMMPYRKQDEYCEWFAYRNGPGGAIDRIVFTAEAPEYWVALAAHDFDLVVKLYQKWVSPDVRADDLRLVEDISFGDETLHAGSYNPYNEWNTRKGCMHLTHPANTLGAEINLAAFATVMYKDNDGNRVSDVRAFACAGTFGDVNRSSDPSIGSFVNLAVWPAASGSKASSVTLTNPVALYMNKIDTSAITDDQGNVMPGWFTFERGAQGRGLFAQFKAPERSALTMDQIRFDGEAVRFGGQLADKIKMILYATTADLNQPDPVLVDAPNHCCMVDDALPISKKNFVQTEQKNSCQASGFVEAYKELIPKTGILAGIAPVQTPPQNRSASRRMASMDVFGE